MIYLGKSESINIWVVKNTLIKTEAQISRLIPGGVRKKLYQIKYCKYYRHELPRRGYIGRKTQIHKYKYTNTITLVTKKRPHRQTDIQLILAFGRTRPLDEIIYTMQESYNHNTFFFFFGGGGGWFHNSDSDRCIISWPLYGSQKISCFLDIFSYQLGITKTSSLSTVYSVYVQ